MTYLVEVRRTLEWGGYYDAEDEAGGRKMAGLEMTFENADIIDEQVVCKPVNIGGDDEPHD